MTANGHISLPPEGATREELWAWIEKHVPLLEALQNAGEELTPVVRRLRLSPRETDFFRALWMRRGRAVPVETILDEVYWDRPDHRPERNIVSVMLCHVRKKIRPHGYDIETLWGGRYLLRLPDGIGTGNGA